MAIKKEVECSCPECGEIFSSMGYEVVNGSVDAGLRESIVSGKIFDFSCPACDHRFRQIYSTAYQDMEKECMIFLNQGKDDFLDKMEETRGLFPNYTFRVVSDMMAYIEKIHIFSAGLNDKVIAYLEACIKNNILNRKDETGIEPEQILFDSLRGKKGLICFGVLNPQKKKVLIETPANDYLFLLHKSELKENFTNKENDYYIDEKWASRLAMPYPAK